MLLNVSGVSKAFGVDRILEGVSFKLQAREKVALVGRNGSGKTTLLKILSGSLAPDAGHVHLARGAKVGYLRQESQVDPHRTVLEEAQAGVQQAVALRSRLDELERLLESTEPSTEDLEEYALLHEHFLESEGYSVERDLRTVLARVGFLEHDLDKPTAKLSGGERTRLALARLLLEEPDLLILDEPTNHLDLQATEWLEGWIRGYHGAVLIVSHDRAFLQNVAQQVLELRDGRVKSYPEPFDKFLKLRSEEESRLAEVARRQREEIAKLDEYVRRFMGSERTAQARGRLKRMEKLIATKVEAPRSERGMAAGIKASKRSGDLVVEAKGLSMSYGGQRLFADLDWTVRLGERWGVIGENGAGKSTLVKIVLGLIQPIRGTARLGAAVEAGYFAQDGEQLDPEQTPLDFMVYECGLLPAEARTLLGRYLFSGDDVFRPIRTLSGGEKNKLSLARLTTLNPNLLVLDEPTNHLDMDSREALASVLQDYGGTLILVSHDRWLLSQTTNRTLDLRRSGAVLYPGSYEEYRRRDGRAAPATSVKQSSQAPPPTQTTMSPREISKEIARLTKLVAETEEDVASLETQLAELERELSALPPDADVYALTLRHSSLQEDIAGRLAAWEEQSLRLEELRGLQASPAL
ncbi:MAG TPA: ABC-F family ATP-binding cassette domain-containing protein [Fimbriimonadaceae bacterium]|nr:ABC-F family ATP-binding cassette domain-containing protein [Fimbriimonadaceae bacterium]